MSTSRLPPLLRAMRPSQWVKNLLVAAAPAAAGALDDPSVVGNTILAFIAFSLAASATYLANDAADVDADRLHPEKRHRPIAAGELSVRTAVFTATLLAVAALAIAAATAQSFVWVILGYVALTSAYSYGLKHVVVIDVLAVTGGFLLRAIGGGLATELPITAWFYLVVGSGALLLIVGKRLGEFRSSHGSEATRRVLRHYSLSLLRALLALAGIGGIVGYVGWAIGEAADLGDRGWLIFVSIVPFVGGVLRYGWLSEQGRGESPDKLVFRDPPTVLFGAVWALFYGIAIYG